MYWYWESVVRPLLVGSEARAVVEIGTGLGRTTHRLLELARERGISVDIIDPEPGFDVEAAIGDSAGRVRFHRARSHDVLERVGAVDVVLIDGDHNWYTVHGELTRLAAAARDAERPLPAVLLHDVEWPYGRRDMYYDPGSVPERHRQAWARKGLVPGQRQLSENGGQWREYANALEEGTPQNGVLTAVEDFIEASPTPLLLRVLHGWFGLGVLVSEPALTACPGLRSEWERLGSAEFAEAHAERLAGWAARQLAASMEAASEVSRLRRELDRPGADAQR
ncbi:MAG TPA: class I SAM-dependent methyltransferase [Solirubrobacterales bacterium]|jgi:SAM-dependent methyltransferase|nr:class I SAM-dependent methyltransferase [Solirubrobacterales bacterium]